MTNTRPTTSLSLKTAFHPTCLRGFRLNYSSTSVNTTVNNVSISKLCSMLLTGAPPLLLVAPLL